ncbi:MAG TPA: hypothetical protein DEQ43_09750 [Nocardioides bacterium]|nr:hypothetical protein [Nocardioides sp.]
MASTFTATHKITITGLSSVLTEEGVTHVDEAREILVQEEDGAEGGRILYTQEEWDAGVPADWELDADGHLTYCGGAYPGTGVEVRIKRL